MAIMQGSAAMLAGAMAVGVLASLLTGTWLECFITKPKFHKKNAILTLQSCVLTIARLERFSFCG